MNIDADDKTFAQLFSAAESSERSVLHVPTYQRDYAWTIQDKVPQLWEDLVEAYHREEQYFLGTIVISRNVEQDAQKQFIVDGQQRLTTLYLMAMTLLRRMREEADNKKGTADEKIAEFLDQSKQVLVSIVRLQEPQDDLSVKTNPRIHLNRKDEKEFRKLFRNDLEGVPITKPHKRSSRVLKTYNWFLEAIDKRLSKFSEEKERARFLQRFTQFIAHKLLFVTVTVETDYEAYLIFESLNSKGLRLTVADLVKNRLLMTFAQDSEDVDERAEDWDAIVSLIEKQSRVGVDQFLTIHWNAFISEEVTPRSLYDQIRKKLVQSTKLASNGYVTPNDYLKQTGRVSEILTTLAPRSAEWPSSQNALDSLESYSAEAAVLGYSSQLPVLVAAKEFGGQSVSEEKLAELLWAIIVFIFRQVTIAQKSVRVVLKPLNESVRALRNGERVDTIINNLRKSLNDDDFKKDFAYFRSTDNDLMRYVLTRVGLTLDQATVPFQKKNHLEHILPQSFVKKAQEPDELDRRWEMVYSVGNVTLWLDSENQKHKDGPVINKLIDYENSSLKITKGITEFVDPETTEWGEEQIRSRAEFLADIAAKTWTF